jgi:hypothetical protein
VLAPVRAFIEPSRNSRADLLLETVAKGALPGLETPVTPDEPDVPDPCDVAGELVQYVLASGVLMVSGGSLNY